MGSPFATSSRKMKTANISRSPFCITYICRSSPYSSLPSHFLTCILTIFIITDHLRKNIENYTDVVDANCKECMHTGKYTLKS